MNKHKILLILGIASAFTVSSSISAQSTLVHSLADLSSLSDNTEFRYSGEAIICDINQYGLTADDGSSFITLSFDKSKAIPEVERGEILHRVEGIIVNSATANVVIDGTTIDTFTEYYIGEVYPIVANEWEGFESYPNRMAVFYKVSITDNTEQPEYYTATAANGSKALIDKTSSQGIELGENKCIVATPRISSATTILEDVRVDDPVKVVKSLSEISKLPASSVFRYDGDATVYYSSSSQGFVLDDGERFSHLAIEYIPASQWPKPGEVITGFTGRIKYRKEGSTTGGGTFYSIRANGTSIAKSGEMRELVPIVAKDDEFFDKYMGRLSTYHNIEIIESDYYPQYYEFMVKHPCGYSGLMSQSSVEGDGIIELGKYESITCIPLYSSAEPYPILTQVKLGKKAGVAEIEADGEQPLRYLDVYGRCYDVSPTTPGVYIEQYRSGRTRKVIL